MTSRLRAFVMVSVILVGACGGATATQAPTAAPATAAPATAAPATAAPATAAPATAAPATAAPATAAPATASASAEPAGGASLSMTRLAEFLPVFHPTFGASNQYQYFYLVYDPLVRLDLTDPRLQKIKPSLAESWEATPDATTYTFKLRKDVKWQDGEPFTAKDVAHTINWTAHCFPEDYDNAFVPVWNQVAGFTDVHNTDKPVSGVQVIDDYTIKITLASPSALFLRSLADGQNIIVADHIFKEMTCKQFDSFPGATETPIGTGPYQAVKLSKDTVEFHANPNYWGGAPKIPVIFHRQLTPEAAVAALQSGELGLGTRIPSSEYDGLAANLALNVFQVQEVGIVALLLQVDNPVTADKRVREALYYAIDRRAIIASVLNGRAKVLINPPGFVEYPDLDPYNFDPAKATQLLQDAKFDFSRPFRITYDQETPNYPQVLPVIQQQLQNIGMKVELLPLASDPWNVMVSDQKRRGEWDATMFTGGSEGLAPDRTSIYYNCKAKLPTSNYQDCHLDDLFVKARATLDPTAQDAVYHEIAQILSTQVPELYLWSNLLTHAATKKLGGGFTGVPSFERYVTVDVNTWTLAP